MATPDIDYERLPQPVKDNLSAEQWEAAQKELIPEGAPAPETTDYINIKNGQIHTYTKGEPVSGPLLPVHSLAGGRGKDSTQFQTTPVDVRVEGPSDRP